MLVMVGCVLNDMSSSPNAVLDMISNAWITPHLGRHAWDRAHCMPPGHATCKRLHGQHDRAYKEVAGACQHLYINCARFTLIEIARGSRCDNYLQPSMCSVQ